MSPTQQPHPFDVAGLPEEDLRLVEFYMKLAIPVDNLAYTEAFDRLYDELRKAGDTRSKSDIFRRLLNLRKAGSLPRVA
jgi:hypothetical protein